MYIFTIICIICKCIHVCNRQISMCVHVACFVLAWLIEVRLIMMICWLAGKNLHAHKKLEKKEKVQRQDLWCDDSSLSSSPHSRFSLVLLSRIVFLNRSLPSLLVVLFRGHQHARSGGGGIHIYLYEWVSIYVQLYITWIVVGSAAAFLVSLSQAFPLDYTSW